MAKLELESIRKTSSLRGGGCSKDVVMFKENPSGHEAATDVSWELRPGDGDFESAQMQPVSLKASSGWARPERTGGRQEGKRKEPLLTF